MANIELALCDLDLDYIMAFASYMMEHVPGSNIHIFTTPESFFADEEDYDVALLTTDFEEISAFRKKGKVSHRYLLCEKDTEDEDCIFKYQSMDMVIDRIIELKSAGFMGQAKRSKSLGKTKLIGVYSPNSHELSMPFSMALGQAQKEEAKVLFLDLEEISILPQLLGGGKDKNLMDLLYEVSIGNEDIDLIEYTRYFMGFQYISPFSNVSDIGEVEEDTWARLFDRLMREKFDVIVVLFGRTINGFAKHLQRLDKLYLLNKPGDYYCLMQENFIKFLQRAGVDCDMEEVLLPMSAANLSTGSYCLEELLQGNLGVFVGRLMCKNEPSEEALCG